MKPHCLAPFHSVRLLGNSKATPCCLISEANLIHAPDHFDWFNSNKYKNLRKTLIDGKFPAVCNKCESREAAVGASMRSQYFEILQESGGVYGEEGNFEQIQHLDLNFSYLCNLKCRMCSGFRSTKWHEDEVLLSQKINFRIMPSPDIYKVSLNIEFYKNLVNKCPNLNRIDIKGGEPLISQEAWSFLEYLVETGRAPSIEVAFTTNGLVVPDKIELLRKFKSISVCFSIEGTDRAYEYIRGDRKSLQDLERNILVFDRLDSVRISFNFTFQAYNIFQVLPVLRWKIEMAKKLRSYSEGQIRMDQCVLTSPEYLQVTVLPFEVRESAAKEITENVLYQTHQNVLEPLVQYLKNRTLDHRSELDRFRTFTRSLDEIRHENVREALPELKEVFSN